MENVGINNLMNMVVEDTSREVCIEKLPFLLAKRALLERLKEQEKIIKKEIELATKVIGPYKNEYFEIKEKTSTKKTVKVMNLDKAMEEIEEQISTMEVSKQALFNQLKMQIEEDRKKALITNQRDKIKLLKQIDTEKANKIVEQEVSKVLELKESKSLLEEIERQKNENTENGMVA